MAEKIRLRIYNNLPRYMLLSMFVHGTGADWVFVGVCG